MRACGLCVCVCVYVCVVGCVGVGVWVLVWACGHVWVCGCIVDSRGLYYKTLRICYVPQMDRFCHKLVSFILSDTNTLAYYGIHALEISNVL
jgi:hypothetical protein